MQSKNLAYNHAYERFDHYTQENTPKNFPAEPQRALHFSALKQTFLNTFVSYQLVF